VQQLIFIAVVMRYAEPSAGTLREVMHMRAEKWLAEVSSNKIPRWLVHWQACDTPETDCLTPSHCLSRSAAIMLYAMGGSCLQVAAQAYGCRHIPDYAKFRQILDGARMAPALQPEE